MLHKLRIALAVTLMALAAVSAVDSASAKGGGGQQVYLTITFTNVLVSGGGVSGPSMP